MPTPKTWESTYNGKRLHFDKELNVLCEIDTGWTANIDTWERTMYPPIIAMDSRTVSGVTFTWDNGDAAATDNMISAYTTYWGWIDSGGTEHYIDNSTATTQTKIRECSAEYIEPGTPIILWARQTPYEGQYYVGEHLLPSLFSSCTFTTLSRLMTVTTITITNLSPSSFNVVWNTVPNAIGYQVFLYLGDGDEGDTPISSTTTNGSALTYTNLSADTTYSIRIIANADGIEYADSLISHPEHTHLDPLIPLDPPQNIQLVDRTESTLTFTWEPPESVVGLTGYTVSIRGVGDYVVDANTNTITLTNLREGVEYVVWFKSNGDKLDYDDSVEVSATGTPMRQSLIVSSAKFPSSETIYWDPDTGYTYGIQPQLNLSTPASVYTSVISGWSYDTVDWDSKTALTPVQITLTNKTLNSITVSLSTPETDWQGNHVVGINEGRTYLNPTTTTQNKSVTTKTFTGLNPETDYTISVLQQITNSDKYFAWDSPSLYTLSTMGQARQVTNLRMISSTVTSVTFAWEVGLFGVGYNVHYKRQRNFVPTTATTKQELDYNTTQITITGLSGSTGDTLAVYYIGVVTRGDGVNFVDSDIVTASGTTQALLKLSGYTISETHTARTIKINWTTPSYGGTPKGYYIWVDGGLLDYVSNTTRTYTVTGCDPTRTYRYGIIAEGDNVYNTRSDVVSGTVTTSSLTPLATPTVTCTNRGANNLTFGWGAISHASGYLVETGTTSSNWQRVGTITDTSIVLNGLQPEHTYYIRVQAVAASDSEYESSQFGEANGTTLSLVKLQPPRNITLIGMTPTTLKYSYNHPADTSGLTGYTFYKNNVVYSNKASGTTREIEFTNLTPNTQYTLGFRSMGDQSYASDSDIVNVYGTPLPEELVISSNKFPSSETSYWDPTTGYTYAIQPSLNLSTPANVFTTVFTGWTFDTTDWQSKTALTPVSITLVSWDYTSAVTNFSTAEGSSVWNGNYLIEVASGRTFTQSNVVTSFTKTKSTTSCNITNLLEGQEYTIRIYQNLTSSDNYFVMNDGSYYTFRTKQHVLPVTNLSAVTVDVTSLTFTWDSALYASGYDVHFKTGTTITTADTKTALTTTMITYNNLTGQTNYVVGVVSKGDGVNFGDATAMTIYNVRTLDLVKLTGVTLTATALDQRTIRLNWGIENTDGVTGYSIYVSQTNTKPANPHSVYSGTSTTSLRLVDLSANRQYYFWVVANGHKVYYTDSDPVSASTSTLAPEKLPKHSLYTWTQDKHYITLRWNVLSASNEHTAVNYSIYSSRSATTPSTPYETTTGGSGAVREITITDLTPGTRYYFWIVANGDGVWTQNSDVSNSHTTNTTDLDKLVVTIGSTTNITPNSFTINWSVNYSQVNNFIIYSGTTNNPTTVVDNNVSSSKRDYTFNGLTPNTPYYFGVVAKGDNYNTTDSDKATGSTRTSQLTQLYITDIQVSSISAKSMTVAWTVSGSPVSSYTVQVSSTTYTFDSGVTSHRFTGLNPNTSYTIKVKAIGVDGQSLTSAERLTTTRTIATSGLSITNLTQTASTKTSASISWSVSPTIPSNTTYAILSGTSYDKVVAIGLTSPNYTINGLSSGMSYNFAVSAMTTNENYTNSTLTNSAKITVKTNYVGATAATLTNFNATYSQIPASGTGNNYVTPTNATASSITSYTVWNYAGQSVPSDDYTSGARVTISSFSGVPDNTGSGFNTNNGGVKVDTRGTTTGSQWTVYTVYGVYNNVTSNNGVVVQQEKNEFIKYQNYGTPVAPSDTFTANKVIPASSYTATVGTGSSDTVKTTTTKLNAITQTRDAVYTSGSYQESYSPGYRNITCGFDGAHTYSSLGTNVVPSSATTVNIWYAANGVTGGPQTVTLERSENAITSGSTITVTNYSDNSMSNRIQVQPSSVTLSFSLSGVLKYTSSETAVTTNPDDYTIELLTGGNSGNRNYTTGKIGTQLTMKFSSLGTNTTSTANTTISFSYVSYSTRTKYIYVRELANTSQVTSLNVNWNNFQSNFDSWSATTLVNRITSFDYTRTYTSQASQPYYGETNLSLLSSVSSTNNNFSASLDTTQKTITLTTTKNTGSSIKTTQIVVTYSGATYTSDEIAQPYYVVVSQSYSVSSVSLGQTHVEWSGDTYVLVVDNLRVTVTFNSPMNGVNKTYHLAAGLKVNGTEDEEGINLEYWGGNTYNWKVPSNSGATTLTILHYEIEISDIGETGGGTINSVELLFRLDPSQSDLNLNKTGSSTWVTIRVQ